VIDIGVNLLHPQFDPDRDAVLDRAWRAGVEHIVVTGTDLAASADAAAFAARHGASRLSATAGIHPHDARQAPQDWLERLEALCRGEAVVAVGETGLDFNRNFSPPEDQLALFEGQTRLAARLGLPLFVHDREASDAVAGVLAAEADFSAGVVVHCFTGDREALRRYLALGCWIGVTGWVCDPRRGRDLRALAPEIPLERLLVETDAPFLRPGNAPRDDHGRRNEPALLPWVIETLAACRGEAPEALAAATADNARRFFRLGPA